MPATSSDRDRLKPDAELSSPKGSSSPACAGAYGVLPASPPYAARKPAGAGRKTGSCPALRRAWRDAATYKIWAIRLSTGTTRCSAQGRRFTAIWCGCSSRRCTQTDRPLQNCRTPLGSCRRHRPCGPTSCTACRHSRARVSQLGRARRRGGRPAPSTARASTTGRLGRSGGRHHGLCRARDRPHRSLP